MLMGLLAWLHKRRAVRLIENDLARLKASGLFDADPREAAQNVVGWGVLSVPYRRVQSLHPNVMAVAWMLVYVLKDSLPREERLPYANAAVAMLRRTIEIRRAELTQEDGRVLEAALRELAVFIEQPHKPPVG